jgi:hypothetical protein
MPAAPASSPSFLFLARALAGLLCAAALVAPGRARADDAPPRPARAADVRAHSRAYALPLATLAGGASSSSCEIPLHNDLCKGATAVSAFKDGRLLAHKTGFVPGQKAVFEFKPTPWIGAASQIEEGATLNSAAISDIDTKLTLLGLASADIVMTGGGGGSAAAPYRFQLANVVMCRGRRTTAIFASSTAFFHS